MYYNFGSKLHSFFSQIKMEMHEVIVYIYPLAFVYTCTGETIFINIWGKK